MITIVGGSGAVGRQVRERLAGGGVACRAVTRSAARVAPGPGTEVAVGDVADTGFLDDVCRGASALFVLPVGELDVRALLHSARMHAARRVVAVSSLLVETHPRSVIGGALASFEDVLSGFPGQCTVLRPWEFASNALDWAPEIRASGSVTVPELGEPSPTVDPRDVGDVAADALLSGEHDGRQYPLTGPDRLDLHTKVDILGSVLDTGIELRVDESLRASIAREALDEVTAALSAPGVSGLGFAGRLSTVREIRGAEPRSFRDWAEDHAARFTAA